MSDAVQFLVNIVTVVFFVALLACAYFLPSIVAMKRNHHQSAAILILNLLTGWTFVGWLIAIVWSLTWVRPQLPPHASDEIRRAMR